MLIKAGVVTIPYDVLEDIPCDLEDHLLGFWIGEMEKEKINLKILEAKSSSKNNRLGSPYG